MNGRPASAGARCWRPARPGGGLNRLGRRSRPPRLDSVRPPRRPLAKARAPDRRARLLLAAAICPGWTGPCRGRWRNRAARVRWLETAGPTARARLALFDDKENKRVFFLSPHHSTTPGSHLTRAGSPDAYRISRKPCLDLAATIFDVKLGALFAPLLDSRVPRGRPGRIRIRGRDQEVGVCQKTVNARPEQKGGVSTTKEGNRTKKKSLNWGHRTSSRRFH